MKLYRRAKPDTYTKLLVKAFGANGSVTFKDFSQYGHTITPYGNTQMSTAQAKFPPVSAYFDGSGDYLSIPDSEDWNFGSGDFTIDFWVRFADLGSHEIVARLYDSTDRYMRIYFDSTNGISFRYRYNAVDLVNFSQGSVSGWNANTWYHLAIIRNGNNFNIYRDGVSVASISSSNFLSSIANDLTIGFASVYWGNNFQGYLDEIRISKGIARWTSNFTPPTRRY